MSPAPFARGARPELASGTAAAETDARKEWIMATNRVPVAFAEFVKFLSNMVRGLAAGARSDAQQKEYFGSLSHGLEMIVRLDRRQEALKVQLGKMTSELESEQRAAKATIARVVSYLEYKFGKTSSDLHKYGLAPRRFVARRKAQPADSGAAAQ